MCYFAPMTQADRVRQFALDRYVVPARTRNAADVVIRAGDVHREMALFSAMPAVCSAIGSRKFEEVSGATIVKRTGPTNGANVYFHVSLVAVRILRRHQFQSRDRGTTRQRSQATWTLRIQSRSYRA
jgi:hypothetical protein